jgi:hypothetical protein
VGSGWGEGRRAGNRHGLLCPAPSARERLPSFTSMTRSALMHRFATKISRQLAHLSVAPRATSTRLFLSIAGLWDDKRTERRQNSWATVKTTASRVFALKGHDMSARGKRSDAAAERRPGLPIDGFPIALKGRNRRRSSDHARPSGLAFVAPFQGFVTRFDWQPRATQPLVELADACPGLTCSGPFRAIEFVYQTIGRAGVEDPSDVLMVHPVESVNRPRRARPRPLRPRRIAQTK